MEKNISAAHIWCLLQYLVYRNRIRMNGRTTLSISLFLYISISLYLYFSISLFIYISLSLYLYISISLFLYISISLYLYFSISLFLYFSISVFLYFSISLFLYFSISLFLYFSISLFLYFSISLPPLANLNSFLNFSPLWGSGSLNRKLSEMHCGFRISNYCIYTASFCRSK
jgi:hypothetical protein